MPHREFIGPDGSVWPSATELTSLLPQPWKWRWFKSYVQKYGWRGWQHCDALSRRSMRLGTHMHGIIEEILTNKPYIAYLNKERNIREPERHLAKCRKAAEAVVACIVREDIVAVEKHVVDYTLRLHGTIDCVMKDSIDDWKSSKKISDDYAIQLAIYALAEGNNKYGRILRRAIDAATEHVQVKSYPDLHYYIPVVKALRVIWDYVNKAGPWES